MSPFPKEKADLVIAGREDSSGVPVADRLGMVRAEHEDMDFRLVPVALLLDIVHTLAAAQAESRRWREVAVALRRQVDAPAVDSDALRARVVEVLYDPRPPAWVRAGGGRRGRRHRGPTAGDPAHPAELTPASQPGILGVAERANPARPPGRGPEMTDQNTAAPEQTFNLITEIIAYEQGELAEDETIALFQYLVDTGLAWSFQGHYGRTAVDLIEAGMVTPAG